MAKIRSPTVATDSSRAPSPHQPPALDGTVPQRLLRLPAQQLRSGWVLPVDVLMGAAVFLPRGRSKHRVDGMNRSGSAARPRSVDSGRSDATGDYVGSLESFTTAAWPAAPTSVFPRRTLQSVMSGTFEKAGSARLNSNCTRCWSRWIAPLQCGAADPGGAAGAAGRSRTRREEPDGRTGGSGISSPANSCDSGGHEPCRFNAARTVSGMAWSLTGGFAFIFRISFVPITPSTTRRIAMPPARMMCTVGTLAGGLLGGSALLAGDPSVRLAQGSFSVSGTARDRPSVSAWPLPRPGHPESRFFYFERITQPHGFGGEYIPAIFTRRPSFSDSIGSLKDFGARKRMRLAGDFWSA